MSETVDILLATFNGARYLREQLDSIIGQSYGKWRLLVRDDGSTDDTLQIIREYRTKFPDKIIKLESDGNNLGVIANYSLLLGHATSDYIMFCDQDDIWLPDKISLSLGKIVELENEFGRDIPLMVYSDLKVVDNELEIIADSFWKDQRLNPDNGMRLNRLLLHNIPTGCTIMLNRPLRELATPIPGQAVMHDWWISLVAAAFGKSRFIAQPTVLYRQHGDNVIGAEPWSLATDIKQFLTPSLRGSRTARRDELLASYRQQALLFLDRYSAKLSVEQREMVHTFATLDNYIPLMQKFYILKYRFFYSNPLVTAGMILFRW